MPVATVVASAARSSVASESDVAVRSRTPWLSSPPIVMDVRVESTIASVESAAVTSVTAASPYPFSLPVPDAAAIVPVPLVSPGAVAPSPIVSVPFTTMPPGAVHVLPAATVAA